MNDLKNTTVYKDFTHEDIDMLEQSVTNINAGVEDLLYLLKLNKLPLAEKLVKLVESKKIRLVFDEELSHATVKWVVHKGMVFVNATPHTKRKRGLDEAYNIPSNELYSLIAGAAVFLYSEKFNRDRNYIKDCLNGYMEMMGKAITRCTSGHFSGTSETTRFYYLIGKYLLKHNNTAITNIDAFASNISGVDERDVMALNHKYEDSDFEDINKFISNVLVEEFSWMEKLKPAALLQTLSVMYGACNTYMLENMDCIGAIIADHIVGARPNLFSRYSNLKSIFKSTAYNNILEILKNTN